MTDEAMLVLDAQAILHALRRRHQPPVWVFFEELRVGTGFGWLMVGDTRIKVDSAVDAWAMGTWRSSRYARVSYEVKVSRSDWLRELRKPQKRLPALMVSNEFYFATPEGLVQPDEVPAEAGLVWVRGNGTTRAVKKAPWRATGFPGWMFFASVARRALIAENGGSGKNILQFAAGNERVPNALSD